LYGLRSAVGAAAGLRAMVLVTALRLAAMNSRRSVLTMHGDVAADAGGALSLGPADAAGAPAGGALSATSAAEAAAGASAALWVLGIAGGPSSQAFFLVGGHGRLASRAPCTSCRAQPSTPIAYATRTEVIWQEAESFPRLYSPGGSTSNDLTQCVTGPRKTASEFIEPFKQGA